MHISMVAKMAQLPIKTVRYYADIGLVRPKKRTSAGYRIYDEASASQLIFVRRARAFGFSIPQCRELLELYGDENRSSADVKKLASQRLAEIKDKQTELQFLHDALAALVHSCRGDDQSECPILDSFAQK